eukprot:1098752-Rhodomonas_salina.1
MNSADEFGPLTSRAALASPPLALSPSLSSHSTGPTPQAHTPPPSCDPPPASAKSKRKTCTFRTLCTRNV